MADSMRSLKKQRNADEIAKRKRAMDEQKVMQQAAPARVGEEGVFSVTAREHFLSTVKTDRFYTLLAAAAPTIRRSTTLFQEVATLAVAPREQGEDFLPQLAPCDAEEQPRDYCFRVVLSDIGAKKFSKVAPGTGRRLKRHDVVIAMCTADSNLGSEFVPMVTQPMIG